MIGSAVSLWPSEIQDRSVPPRTMPRRPRPASRRPPARAAPHPQPVERAAKSQRARETEEDSTSSASGSEDLFESEGDEGSSSLGDSSDSEESIAAEAEVPDVDGARVVQWVDDEEVEEVSEAESESESGASEEEPQHTVREQCRILPFNIFKSCQSHNRRTGLWMVSNFIS